MDYDRSSQPTEEVASVTGARGTAASARITVVVADAHPIVAVGLEALLSPANGFSVRARCATGDEALAAVRTHRPDILLTEVELPGKDGLAVLRQVKGDGLPTRTILLVGRITGRQVREALRLGVAGVVLKGLAPDLLQQCLRKVHRGERWIERSLMEDLVDRFFSTDAEASEGAERLTPREIDVTRMIASGLRTQDIADRLTLAQGTVKQHLHNVYRKLKIRNRVELTHYAHHRGLVDI